MHDVGTNPYAPPKASPFESPTNVRWGILALLMAYAGLVHFNRISITVAGTEKIMPDYGISETQMGMVYSAYLFVYTICMMPGGWLIDRVGPKKALLFLGLGSAVLVPMTGATSFAGPTFILLALFVIRGLLGLVSAPIHPAAARAVSFWMPVQGRGVANGLVTGAAVTGIALTYFVFGFLMDSVGWPTAFLLAGIATLLLALAWSAYATDHPSQHPAVNASEREWIEEGDPTPVEQTEGIAGYLELLVNRSLIMLTVSYAALSYFQYLFFYWMQYYFKNIMKMDDFESRVFATLPMLAMSAGMISGGWLGDFTQSRLGGWSGRALTPVGGMLASGVLLLLGLLDIHPAWTVTCFTLSMGALGASESAFWVTGVELGGKRGGLSGAFLNTIGNIGGILAPVITPLFSSYFGWKAGLALASVLCIIGAGMWWWVDPPLSKKRV